MKFETMLCIKVDSDQQLAHRRNKESPLSTLPWSGTRREAWELLGEG